MPWKFFSHYAVWNLNVKKINCMTWNWLKSWFSPLGVRFISLLVFFNPPLSVNNKLVNNRLVDPLEKYGLNLISSMVLDQLSFSINCRSSGSSIWWNWKGFYQVWGYLSCSTWCVQGFWHNFAYWRSSQT